MEANETSEGPPATKDEKEQPSLKVPSTEDLPEATTHESPLHLSSSQNYLQSPEVHIKTYSSLDPDSKDSEDLQDPSVSETPLKLDTAELPSTPFQLSPQSVTSLERATIEIPSENFVYENSISEVQEEPLQLSSTTTIPEHENPISEVQEELLEGTPAANTPEYVNPISEVQEELLEGTPTANTPEYENPISEVQEELLEGTPTANTPEYENPISEVQEELLEGTPTAHTPEYENPISEVQEEPLEGTPTANIPEYENPISEVQEEPLEGTSTANTPEYENPISEVQEEPLEGTSTANTPEYENPISEVQEELLEGTPTANIPEYENPISEVQEELLEGTPTAHIPESSDELTSDKVPETQVPESEHFPKHSFSEPSAQAEKDEEDKEDAAANKEEAGEDELTGGTSNIAAARPQHHGKKKKEKRACGFASRPAVPAKRAELVEMAKAMHRKQFDDQVNNLFQWEKNSFLKAIQTGIYIGWRCPHYLWDCFRIGDESKCFCGHLLKEHQIISDLSVPCSVSQCRCLMFCFIPSRPEEVGEFWLKKRATFDPKAWRAQCRCKHTHEEHAATGAHPCRHRGCYCNSFESNFLCAACDRRWEEHETFFETEETRRRGKRPYGTSTVKNWHRPL